MTVTTESGTFSNLGTLQEYKKKELELLKNEKELIQEQISQLQHQLHLVEKRIELLTDETSASPADKSKSPQKRRTSKQDRTKRSQPSLVIDEVVEYSGHETPIPFEQTLRNDFATPPPATKRQKGSRTGSSSKQVRRTPSSSGRRPSIFDRLTDPKTFTGSSKERFDAYGRGRGLAGRRDFYPNGVPYDEVFPRDSPALPTEKKREVEDDPATRVMLESVLKMDSDAVLHPKLHSRSSSGSSIYEHLSDPSTFTGIYKKIAEEGEILRQQHHHLPHS